MVIYASVLVAAVPKGKVVEAQARADAAVAASEAAGSSTETPAAEGAVADAKQDDKTPAHSEDGAKEADTAPPSVAEVIVTKESADESDTPADSKDIHPEIKHLQKRMEKFHGGDRDGK